MTIDILHSLVTSAIWRAEQLDTIGLDTESAWMEVSKLEEQIAKVLPASAAEGRVARRGAVRAALKATDQGRAQQLFDYYVAETAAPKALRAELRAILKEDSKHLSEQFPFAAKYHKPNELQMLANRLLRNGPFWLAA